MIEKFKRSWSLAKKTFSVMNKEKELYLFSALSILFTILFLSVFFLIYYFYTEPIVSFFNSLEDSLTLTISFLLLFLMYFGVMLITTFFNFCVVYTTAIRFQGKNADFYKTIKHAFSQINLIILWGLLASTVGMILKIIEIIAQKMKGVGGFLLRGISFLGGLAWFIATIFVIPVMVYKGSRPFEAIKHSTNTLKKTWGESLIKLVGINLAGMAFVLIGGLIYLLLLFLASNFEPIWTISMWTLSIIFLIYLLIISILFSIANQVFDTALYVYAETGYIVPEYDKETIKGAFKSV